MDIPAVITQHDACSDSTLLIATTATEIYKAYRDSLIGVFNEAYTAKCLNAGTLESFTVNKPVSEYHFTLYYYDQAGNLIKTISPEGVHPNRDSVWLSQVRQKRAVGDIQIPTHTLTVVYRYNSLNQVITQNSPDGGYSKFWYDRLGRLVVSQNAKQLAAGNYSYTRYDYLGRITEVGEKNQVTAMSSVTSRSQSSLQSWLNYTYTQSSQTILAQQVTRTVYDVAATLPLVSGTTAYNFHQKSYTIRNRVSNTLFYDVLLPGTPDPQYAEYTNGSYYSYDIHGNVDTLLQDYRLGLMASNGANRFKLTAYNYDLISGKVNQVHYQPGEKDQFYHRYEYDAENRITDVFTTNIKEFIGVRNIEDHEAVYQYYKHGPLARTLLGNQQVQGIDYAYTLQGWLKGVNSTSLMPARDMGGDDGTFIARDAYSFSLNYFTGDYSAINGARDPFPGHTAYFTGSEYKALYNGNISSMTVNISKFAPQLYNYKYDQLNRLISMDAYVGLNQTNNSWASLALTNNYKERVSYDANGNILSYLRNGTTAGGKQLAMDNLTYNYFSDGSGNKRNNRLRMVRDSVNNNNYTEDIDDQLSAVNNAADSNYVYDEIGNLIQDKAEKITSIKWNVYGKILEINKTATLLNPVTKISYTYDAAGNRISKKTEKGAASETTWYVRDAQGNVLGVYTDKNSLTLTEHHIYGSSRLGIANRDLTVADPSVTGTSLNLLGNSYLTNFERGKKFFELSNHLGNVLVTISDRKLQVLNTGTGSENNGGCEVGSGVNILSVSTRNGEASYTARSEVNLLPGFSSIAGEDYVGYIDNTLTTCVPYTPPTTPAQGWYYAAEIVGANDYYPFGMLMPGRKFSSGSYRYGFNGKENDNDVKGDGNQQDYGMRISDPRLGRFLSVDPLAKNYPMLTPYQFSSNNPVWMIDLDGMEGVTFNDVWEGRANIVDWINDPDTWVDGARHVNETVNPIYQAYGHGYEIATGKDFNTGEFKGRGMAFSDLGVNIVQWGSGEKLLTLFTVERVLQKQVIKQSTAMEQSAVQTTKKITQKIKQIFSADLTDPFIARNGISGNSWKVYERLEIGKPYFGKAKNLISNRYTLGFFNESKGRVIINGIPSNDVALGVEQNIIDLYGGAGKSVKNPLGNRIPATTDAARIKQGEDFLNSNYKNWRKKDFTPTKKE